MLCLCHYRRAGAYRVDRIQQSNKYMFLPVFVCLSVCLLARLLKNAAYVFCDCYVSLQFYD